MSWYVKLFAPVIASLLTWASLWLLIEVYSIRPVDDDLLVIIMLGIAVWGGVQTLYFPRRAHKPRKRGWLIACILLFAMTISTQTVWYLRFYAGRNSLLSAFYVQCHCFAFYFFRYREKAYSLAPKFAELKQLCVLAALTGLAVIMFFVFCLEATNIFSGIASRKLIQQFMLGLVLLFLVAAAGGISFYYIEAILHHLRNSPKAWDKRLDDLGGD